MASTGVPPTGAEVTHRHPGRTAAAVAVLMVSLDNLAVPTASPGQARTACLCGQRALPPQAPGWPAASSSLPPR